MSRLTHLSTYDPRSGRLNVIIETPKGSRNKFDYEENDNLFVLGKVLPPGHVFPYDFGFVPSTRAQDGDPLDVLLLMDEAAYPGILVKAQLIGVVEGEQADGGDKIRNDRLIAVCAKCQTYHGVRLLKDLPGSLLDGIENFFVSYHALDDKRWKLLGHHGPAHAEELVRAAEEHYRQMQADSDTSKPKKKAKKILKK